MSNCVDVNSAIENPCVLQDAGASVIATDTKARCDSSIRSNPARGGLIRGADCLQRPDVMRQWREISVSALEGSAFLQPDVAETLTDSDNGILVYCAQCDNSSHSETANGSVAVFAPKRMQIRPLPGVPLKFTFHGRYAVAGLLIGNNEIAAVNELIEKLTNWLSSNECRDEFFLFEGVEVGSALWTGLTARKAGGSAKVFVKAPPEAHYWIDFPDNPQEYWKRLSTKTQQTLRRKVRKLDHSITVVREPAQVRSFLQKAEHISRNSWQGKALGLRIADTPGQQKVFDALARKHALRSYLLEREDEPLAFLIGFQWNGRFVFDETGYDTRFRDLSPGTVLFYRVLQDLTDIESPKQFDFGIGDGEHKVLFANRQTESASLILARGDFRTTTLFRSMEFRRQLSQQGRRWLRSIDLLYRKVRRFRRQ